MDEKMLVREGSAQAASRRAGRDAYPRVTSIPSPTPKLGDSVSTVNAVTHDSIDGRSASLLVKNVTSVLAAQTRASAR